MDVVFREGCINFPYTNTLCPSLSFLEEFIYAMNRLKASSVSVWMQMPSLYILIFKPIEAVLV